MSDTASDARPFKLTEYDGWIIVTFLTESLMEPAALTRIATALYPIVDEHKHHRVILDFKNVQYLSSQAIGILLTMHKKVSAVPAGQLVLCGVDAKLLQLLKLTRLDKLLKIVPTKAEAVKLTQTA